MFRRRPSAPDPAPDARLLAAALEDLDRARADLAATVALAEPLPVRREAYHRVSEAFRTADSLLRQAAGAARQRPYAPGNYLVWRHWRHLLSTLDVAKQVHLLAESDDVAVLRPGTERALDTGMSKPSIGELQHGGSVAPGTPARYGLELERALRPVRLRRRSEGAGPEEPLPETAPVPLPVPAANTPVPPAAA